MTALIDLDLYLYKGLWSVEYKLEKKEGEWVRGYSAMLRSCNNIIERITSRFPDYQLVMSGENNFRYSISSDYKANRKPENKPQYLHDSREWFKKYWGAFEATGEADDWIAQNHNDSTVAVSFDKDIRQLGGKIWVYNLPHKDEIIEIDNPMFYFWSQCLTGDAADGVKGVPNPEKAHFKKQPCFTDDSASKLLSGKSPEEMKETVLEQYKIAFGEEWYPRFDTSARLLWLRRSPNDEYHDHI